MADLFGLDIASIVNDAIESAGGVRTGVLSRVIPGTRNAAQSSAGTNSTTTTHAFNGFVEQKEVRREGQVSAQYMSVITILAASITPVTIPQVNDTVLLDGISYLLVELKELDPAEAVYEFLADS